MFMNTNGIWWPCIPPRSKALLKRHVKTRYEREYRFQSRRYGEAFHVFLRRAHSGAK